MSAQRSQACCGLDRPGSGENREQSSVQAAVVRIVGGEPPTASTCRDPACRIQPRPSTAACPQYCRPVGDLRLPSLPWRAAEERMRILGARARRALPPGPLPPASAHIPFRIKKAESKIDSHVPTTGIVTFPLNCYFQYLKPVLIHSRLGGTKQPAFFFSE